MIRIAEELRFPEGLPEEEQISAECEDLDNKRKVCVINGETILLNRSKINKFADSPELAKKRFMISEGRDYMEYMEDLMDEEKKRKLNDIKRGLNGQ